MKKLKLTIAEQLAAKLAGLNPDGAPDAAAIADMLEYPPDPKMGDLALPCFKLSKTMRRSPVQIAAALADGFSSDAVSRVEAVNGYFNLYLADAWLTEHVLCRVLDEGETYGSSDIGAGKEVVLDYSSPNVAKPFHIGHLGTTVIGHSIKRLHEFAGYHCTGINHLGDWGTQFGKMIVAYRKWGDRAQIIEGGIDRLVELYVRFHQEAETDPSLENEAREEFHKLEEGNPENIALWQWFIEISLVEYKKTYAQLGIEFDAYTGESFYMDKIPAQIELLRKKELLTVDDGATIVDLSEYHMPPCIILKSDGSTIYHTRDIAAAVYRKDTYHFDKSIYVTSAGQSLHFAQLFKVLELMGYPWYDQLVHVPYGTVSINGAKLATRTGNVVLLKDLFAMAIEKVRVIIEEKNPNLENKDEVAEAVGVGAIVFFYLSNNRNRDINFILEDALSFEGNTGPYAQYTYARTCSIIEKAGAQSCTDYAVTSPEEADLLKVLARFNERVMAALEEYEPSYIVRYILDVCAAFNRFYHNCPILSVEHEQIRATRVALAKATGIVLGNAFGLVCMKKTEKI